VSVGHVARIFEEAGLPTVMVVVKAFAPRVALMRPPRVLVTPHIMGRPFGAPHDVARQREVLHDALGLLAAAQGNGTFAERPDPYRTAPGP